MEYPTHDHHLSRPTIRAIFFRTNKQYGGLGGDMVRDEEGGLPESIRLTHLTDGSRIIKHHWRISQRKTVTKPQSKKHLKLHQPVGPDPFAVNWTSSGIFVYSIRSVHLNINSALEIRPKGTLFNYLQTESIKLIVVWHLPHLKTCVECARLVSTTIRVDHC